MVGINVDGLDSVVKKNNIYLPSLKDSSVELYNNMNEAADCYSGKDLDILFNGVANQKENFSKISNIIDNYSSVLLEVKKSYEAQSSEIISKVNSATF